MKKISRRDLWSKKYPPAENVDVFIQVSPKESQAKLRQIRKIIKTTAPKAEENISYRMPVYKFHGKQIFGFAGFKKHIGFYPMSGSFLHAFKKELKNYETSKGVVRFPLDKPMPVTLIKKLIKARIKEILI